MDIYSYLKKDHRYVEKLFKKLISAKSAAMRKTIYQEIKLELIAHADAEEATFYHTLNKYPRIKKEIVHGKKEHNEIEAAIHELDKISVRSIEWLVQLGVLKQVVHHHITDEENKIFPIAKKVLSNKRAEKLAEEMDELKQKKLGKKSAKKSAKTPTLGRKILDKIEMVF